MIESIEDLIVFLKHFHRNLLADPSRPPEQIPADLPDGLAMIYRELGGLVDLKYPASFATQDTLMSVGDLNRRRLIEKWKKSRNMMTVISLFSKG
jgi:hypothetical protein